jgi:hypothetical protein
MTESLQIFHFPKWTKITFFSCILFHFLLSLITHNIINIYSSQWSLLVVCICSQFLLAHKLFERVNNILCVFLLFKKFSPANLSLSLFLSLYPPLPLSYYFYLFLYLNIHILIGVSLEEFIR